MHHWAKTLSDVYLRGALGRAVRSAPETAAHRTARAESQSAWKTIAGTVDPFALFALGEHALRRELQLFTRAVLRAVVIVHDLNPAGLDISTFTKAPWTKTRMPLLICPTASSAVTARLSHVTQIFIVSANNPAPRHAHRPVSLCEHGVAMAQVWRMHRR